MRDLSIYIHIPFCVRKCLYCDFLSFALSGERGSVMAGREETGSGIFGQDITEHIAEKKVCPEHMCGRAAPEVKGTGEPDWNRIRQQMRSYVNLLKKEIITGSEKYKNHQVISVFWGGGTPSLLDAEVVSEIMGILYRHYHVTADAEITIEANPGTVTAKKLRVYRESGINRLSIGLQSANDEELGRIGRIHDYRTFLETYRLARETGFHNINIDLMSALPGQSLESYAETLKRVAQLAPEHISAYSLILEEGTPLYERQQEYSFPTEDEDREMYLLTESCLSSCGYHRYEISNYAKEGCECRHNKVYWQRGDYVGFGLGAASMVQNVRWSNPAELETYIALATDLPLKERVAGSEFDVFYDKGEGEMEKKPDSRIDTAFGQQRQILTKQEQMEEFMFLGLRMMCGVRREDFVQQFGRKIEEVYGGVLDKMYSQGLLVCEEDHIRLTARGVDVSNYVMAKFLFDS